MWVRLAIMNERLFMHIKRLLTDCSRGKADELCLALTAEITA